MRNGSVILIALLALGVVVTVFWFDNAAVAAVLANSPIAAATALILTVISTSVCLSIRWLRWHFLMRQIGLRTRTRESASVYLATLPMLATPYYVGELLRGALLRWRYPRIHAAIFWVWLTERTTDAAVLLGAYLLTTGSGQFAPLLLLPVFCLLYVLRYVMRRAGGAGHETSLSIWSCLGALLASTALAWSLPVAAMVVSADLFSAALSLPDGARVFADSTLLGAASAIPLGIGVAGSRLVVLLRDLGIAGETAVINAAIFRLGTIWYAVALGCTSLYVLRTHLAAILRPDAAPDHFDEIAHEYPDQLSDSMRERLIERKIELLRRTLRRVEVGDGARGVDLGCGQGWYAVPMQGLGYEIVAIDRSANQLRLGRDAARSRGISLNGLVSDAGQLPLASNSVDFLYAINLFHHIDDDQHRRHALDEIVRVLRPNGVFVMFEMNVLNPLFRFYLSYLFPLWRSIDEGTERWLNPKRLPHVAGARWSGAVDYFTFLPDFLPEALLDLLGPLERALERSRWRSMSAHFRVDLVKDETVS